MNLPRALSAALLAPLATASLGAGPATVAYDWFEYVGRDEVFQAPPPEGSFQNPILAGTFPDPSICRAGDDYYIATSTFGLFPGVPILHSKDLVNWRQIGHALDRASQLKLEGLKAAGDGIYAPTLRFHDGVFYMITTNVRSTNNFYVTAADPAGPWSEPKFLAFVDGIDPSLFFDDDGRVYLTHNGPPPNSESLYEGHRAVWLWEVDLETNEPVGEGRIIVNGGIDLSKQPVWIEAPHLIKKDGWYYLTCAEGGTSENHSQVILRAKTLADEFEPWEGNPILTQRDLPQDRDDPIIAAGHADFVQLPNGDWWASFLAIRPYPGGYYTTGRETYLLPVDWPEGGWPTILEAGKPIPMQLPKPDLPAWDPPGAPLTGNFAWRDEFDSPKLDLAWSYLRAPEGAWLAIDSAKGALLVEPQVHELGALENPTWIGRRAQHNRYDARARLQAPAPGVSAGIAAFIREDYHYFLGLRAEGESYVAFLEKTAGGPTEVVAEKRIPGLALGGPAELSLAADHDTISFRVGLADGEQVALAADEDAKILTTNEAWGFIGTFLGPYARLEL